MAMLKTMTKEAGEPKGSPAGKAAPADKAPAGKTSPEAIRAGLHLQPKEAAQLDRIVLAGRKVMFAKQSHKMFLEQLDGPGDIAQKLGQGVAGLMGLLFTAQSALLFGLLGYFSGSVGAWINRKAQVGQWLDRLAGTVFIALGLRMIAVR